MMTPAEAATTMGTLRNLNMSKVLLRWGAFNCVGLLGVGVQLIVLITLKSWLGIHYLAATAIAVEMAILHNFVWHERWTWLDRTANDRAGMPGRLFRFNLASGLVSISSNVLFMALLVGLLGIHYLPANLMAIAAGTVLNFFASDRLVFKVDEICPPVSGCCCRPDLRNEQAGGKR
jgi:putative flippase GtrA